MKTERNSQLSRLGFFLLLPLWIFLLGSQTASGAFLESSNSPLGFLSRTEANALGREVLQSRTASGFARCISWELRPVPHSLPYGEPVNELSDAKLTFTGLIEEGESVEGSTYAAQYRHYRPGIGRWVKRDPAGFVDGPNLYAYVSNSPNDLTDPSGLYAGPAAVGLGILATLFIAKANQAQFKNDLDPKNDLTPHVSSGIDDLQRYFPEEAKVLKDKTIFTAGTIFNTQLFKTAVAGRTRLFGACSETRAGKNIVGVNKGLYDKETSIGKAFTLHHEAVHIQLGGLAAEAETHKRSVSAWMPVLVRQMKNQKVDRGLLKQVNNSIAAAGLPERIQTPGNLMNGQPMAWSRRVLPKYLRREYWK